LKKRRKRNKEDQEDLSFMAHLNLEDKVPAASSALDPGESSSKKSVKKKGVSPSGASPRFSKDSGMGDSIKKGKAKPATKKKKKVAKD
jgi:hypothetical protein